MTPISKQVIADLYPTLQRKLTKSKNLTTQYKVEDLEDALHNVITSMLERDNNGTPLICTKTKPVDYIVKSVLNEVSRLTKKSHKHTPIFDVYTVTENDLIELEALKTEFFELVFGQDTPIKMLPQQRAVLRYRLEVGDTIPETAAQTGYSERHIRQLTKDALTAIRTYLTNNQNLPLCQQILELLSSKNSETDKPLDILTYFSSIKQLDPKPIFPRKKKSGKVS